MDFLEKFTSTMFGYQQELFAAKMNPLTARIRNILKSRQIGLTYYFAAEAFMDAVLTGDNQIFLSASRAQSEVFRSYIVAFASKWFDIELTGNPIILSKDGKPWAELRFLSTNANTAQSYHGHLYVDEVFWIPRFDKIQGVASGMAAHAKWRQTYFSTPSAVTHEAYPFWTGETFRNSKRGKKAGVWPSEAEIHAGTLCPDGQWRKIITLEDAIAGGCNLFDIDRLRLENDEERFEQLFMCKFIDSTQSVFSLADLESCYSDLGQWKDYDPTAQRPFGDRPVWLGYDPSRTRDDATCVVVAPPDEPGGKFRILKVFLAGAVVHLPGRPGQEAHRALQCPAHRDRYDRCWDRGVRPGVRLLSTRQADPLQPGDENDPGAQSPGCHPGRSHRVGRGLDRHRCRLPDHQARYYRQRSDHLQRLEDGRHRPCRHRLGGHARPAQRTFEHQQAAP